MVRKGSPVRIRQRAWSRTALRRGFCVPGLDHRTPPRSRGCLRECQTPPIMPSETPPTQFSLRGYSVEIDAVVPALARPRTISYADSPRRGGTVSSNPPQVATSPQSPSTGSVHPQSTINPARPSGAARANVGTCSISAPACFSIVASGTWTAKNSAGSMAIRTKGPGTPANRTRVASTRAASPWSNVAGIRRTCSSGAPRWTVRVPRPPPRQETSRGHRRIPEAGLNVAATPAQRYPAAPSLDDVHAQLLSSIDRMEARTEARTNQPES
jgi:hypothetical protein